jgi:phage terminase large subunit-like protein
LFIGTPDGKNHFYNLWMGALTGVDTTGREYGKDWKAWQYHSSQNPFLPRNEILAMEQSMSRERFRQEAEASFESFGGVVFERSMFPIIPKNEWRFKAAEGEVLMAIDLAGFASAEAGRRIVKRDDHAIAIVKNGTFGWIVLDIIHGQWDVRETALRIVKAFRDYRPAAVGIEKGMAMNAVIPYLYDEQARLSTYFEVQPLTHGNNRKADRIQWALQGRAEKGRLMLQEGDWNKKFLDQAVDFPSPLSHDDLIDAVSYVDQLAVPWSDGPQITDTWEPLDEVSGY